MQERKPKILEMMIHNNISVRLGCMLLILLCGSNLCRGQECYQRILDQIEQNSTGLKLAKEKQKAEVLEGVTGILPDNPEIEYSHTWGNESTGENAQGINVSQTIDFPTVYVRKSKLADYKASSASQNYLVSRMDLLLSAKELCIEMTYYNALVKMYQKQVEHAGQIATAQEERNNQGEGNAIEYNKAKLNLLTMENSLKLNVIQLERIHSELVRLNGGKAVAFEETDFPLIQLPVDFEAYYQSAEERHPVLRLLKNEWKITQEEVKLNQAQSLPKISLGYAGQFAGQQNFHGISVGLSIPLWENHNQVQKAKAEAVSAQYQINDSKVLYYNQMKSFYNQAVILQQSIVSYEDFLKENSNAELLYLSFQNGEMTLMEYLIEIGYYFDIYERYLSMKKELAMAHAQLTAFEL